MQIRGRRIFSDSRFRRVPFNIYESYLFVREMVAFKLFGQNLDFKDYYIVLRWIRGILLLPSYWILGIGID